MLFLYLSPYLFSGLKYFVEVCEYQTYIKENDKAKINIHLYEIFNKVKQSKHIIEANYY